MRVRFAASLAVFALAGCGFLGDHSGEEPASATGGQLSIMVVPQDDLGAASAGLKIDRSESGAQTARDIADDTVDPKDSAASVRRAGWEGGYSLFYADSKLKALIRRSGVESVGTSVDSFATAGAARGFILDQVGDLRRFNGRKVSGVKLRDVTQFDAEVGDEAWGVEFTVGSGGLTGYATVVQFRHGRLVGTSVFARGDEAAIRVGAVQLAQKVDERISRVLAGELHESAVPVPKSKTKKEKRTGKAGGSLDPKRFTLTTRAFSGSAVTGQGYRKHGDVRSYVREFRLSGGRLGRSPVSYVRAMTQVLESPGAATDFLAYAESFQGSRDLARTFVRGVLKSSPENLMAGPLPTRGGDTLALVSYFGPRSGGRLSAVMILVRSGRLVGSVTVVGKGNELNPKYVIALAPKLRAQLRAAG